MMETRDDERVMVFIDLRNVIRCSDIMENVETKVDYRLMVRELVGRRDLRGAYAFDGRLSGPDSSVPFHDSLRHKGFRMIVRNGPQIPENPDEQMQKEVDVAMACEILLHALNDDYDTAIIVSGDRDFRPAVEFVQRAGKRVEIAGFSRGMSSTLSRSGDLFVCLDRLPILDVVGIPREGVDMVGMLEATENVV